MWKSSDAKVYAAHNAIVSDANRSDCIIVIVSAFERRNGSGRWRRERWARRGLPRQHRVRRRGAGRHSSSLARACCSHASRSPW